MSAVTDQDDLTSSPGARGGHQPGRTVTGWRRRIPGHGNIHVVFATLALGAGSYTVLQSMVMPALPVIQHDINASQGTVAWLLTAFLLSASIATPILGRLGDLYGKRGMLLVVFGALSLGSLISGLTDSVCVLIAARVIQGLAGAVFPLSFGIIRDEFPVNRVPWAVGVMSAMMGIGSGLGIVLAGPIVDALDWHWLFWFPLMISGAAVLATLLFIPESPVRAQGTVNLPAAATLSLWLLALLVGLSKGASWGWTAPGTLGLFAGAVVGFALWAWVESRSPVPLIDLRMMKIPAVWWTNVAAILLGFGMYAGFLVVPPLLQTPREVGYGMGASVTVSGLYMLPSTVAMLVVSLLIGRVNARFGSKGPLVAGSVITGAAYFLLVADHHDPWAFIVMGIVQGTGIALAFSSMTNLIIGAVRPDQTGVATGMNANIRTIGGTLGAQIVASLLASGTLPSGYPRESSYTISMAVLGVATVAAAVACLLVPVARAARSGGPAGGAPGGPATNASATASGQPATAAVTATPATGDLPAPAAG
ncbi:MAG: MFS transporter [Frankia sp.]|nr:MFS transporter [Frankia sp.]